MPVLACHSLPAGFCLLTWWRFAHLPVLNCSSMPASLGFLAFQWQAASLSVPLCNPVHQPQALAIRGRLPACQSSPSLATTPDLACPLCTISGTGQASQPPHHPGGPSQIFFNEVPVSALERVPFTPLPFSPSLFLPWVFSLRFTVYFRIFILS